MMDSIPSTDAMMPGWKLTFCEHYGCTGVWEPTPAVNWIPFNHVYGNSDGLKVIITF